MKILLVEDDWILSQTLKAELEKRKYIVEHASDGETALDLFGAHAYDLIILDLHLPKIDGFSVLRSVRNQNPDIQVLILTATSDLDVKVACLDAGANDYVTKPFHLQELAARIRNLLRSARSACESILRCGKLCLDTAAKRVHCGDCLLGLTKKEYLILEFLMYKQGTTLDAREIFGHVWESETESSVDDVRFHIHGLRKKLNACGCGEYLITLRGKGYCIMAPNP